VTVRVMTWNIKNGGIDRGRGNRLSAIAAVVNRELPDILAMQELRDFDRGDERRMHEFADGVGMTAHLAGSAFGQPVAVLVRPPLRMTGTKAVRFRLHHAAAVAHVPTDLGPLTVVSTHLNPFSPYRRMREARWLAARYSAKKRPVLLAGDLNGLAPGRSHAAALAGLDVRYRRRHLAPDGSVDTRAVESLLAAGFIDLWDAANDDSTVPTTAGDDSTFPTTVDDSTVPTTARDDSTFPATAGGDSTVPTTARDDSTVPTTAGGGEEFAGMRLDYVLASASVADRARSARVIRGGETEYASDHYPVAVDLDLTGTAV
jgi:exodeoxyribonuclease-3